MNRHTSNFLSFRCLASIFCGLLLIVFGSFYFLKVSAKTENTPGQNLSIGRLVFTKRNSTSIGQFSQIVTANADGSGQAALTTFPPSYIHPSWSPDGSKIIYMDGNVISVMDADGTGRMSLGETMADGNPTWSVTGKIAYEKFFQMWVMNADGSGQIQFPGITQPAPAFAKWSPDGTKLAFVSGGEIWVINADGTNQHAVTMNTTSDSDPEWSRDGLKIIFTKGTTGIGIINADGTNELNLTSVTNDSQPSWSPDGTIIAFRRAGAASGIYTMSANGSNQVRIFADDLTSIGYQNFRPVWQPVAQTPNTFVISGRITHSGASLNGVTVNLSGTVNAAATTDAVGNYQFSGLLPGGNYIVSPSFPGYYFTPANRSFNNLSSNQPADFVAAGVCLGGNCGRNGKIAFTRNSEIFTMNSDGSNQTNITNNAANDTDPNYSPNGASIAFTTNRDGSNEIYRMNADGGNPVRLTNNTASDSSPNYSPDGATIVFTTNRDGNSEIYKMNADGTNQVRLTNDTAQQSTPSFSPDGQKIIYVTASGQSPMMLFTMNADGSNQQPISTPGIFYSRPSYSPDGQKIIFMFGPDVTLQNIWTMNADGSNRTQFPSGGRAPSYSPDGTKVLFICCTDPVFDPPRVRSINADGSSAKLLTTSLEIHDLPDWQPLQAVRRTFSDFDGDGRSDVSVFRPSDGIWYLLGSTSGFSASQWGLPTDALTPADYDGDLKTDLAVWRPSDGNFYILNSFNSTVRIENFGLSGDVPTGGDWDGDGKADLAVYRNGAQGVFYYRGSMGNPQGNITIIPWGLSGDKAVAGDYDGDGRTDAAIYRNGVWWIRQSSNGQSSAVNFGLADDVLVPADYDADGKTDLAVYRGGIWYLLRSAQGFAAFQFGISTDIPAPADYDGDGRADAAIYRNGAWWILKTQSGAAEVVSFGLSSDKPVPSAFVR